MKSLSGLLRSQVVDAEERAEMLESEQANLLEEHKAALFEAQRATAGRKDNSARVICYLHKMNFLLTIRACTSTL